MYTYTGVDLGIAMYACSSCGCLGYNPSQDYYYVVHSNSIGFDQYRLGINTPPWSNSSSSTTSNPYPTNNNEGMGNENEPWDGADNNPYIDPEYNGGQVVYDPNQTLNQNDPCDINIKLDGVQPISTFSKGCITAFASAGNYGGTYTFTISGSNTSIVIGSGSVAFFTNLDPGSYTITVQKNSGDGCSVTSGSFTLSTGNNQDHPYTKTIINNWPCRTCSYAVTYHTDGTPPNINDPNNCQTNNCAPTTTSVIPCPGDPIRHPTICPTKGSSGINGGRNGNTRTKFVEQADGSVISVSKYHDGLDISSPENGTLYSMFEGDIIDYKDDVPLGAAGYSSGSYGNWVIVKCLVNGHEVFIKYNHLNSVNVDKTKSLPQHVTQGQDIGLTGRTGNAAPHKHDSGANPHIHIQIRPTNDFGFGSHSNYLPDVIDPEPYLNTKFDKTTGAPTYNPNC